MSSSHFASVSAAVLPSRGSYLEAALIIFLILTLSILLLFKLMYGDINPIKVYRFEMKRSKLECEYSDAYEALDQVKYHIGWAKVGLCFPPEIQINIANYLYMSFVKF